MLQKSMQQLSMKFFAILGGIVMLMVAGCTKKYDNVIKVEEIKYDTVAALPADRIISYKVTNINEDPIYSFVNDSARTITVYLPAYYQLGVIQPEISLPAGTTISPAADEPVPVFGTSPFTYVVTTAKGVKATYTVKIVVQQQDFTINELTTNPASPRTYNGQTGSTLTVTGINLLANTAVTRGYLMDANGNQVYAFSNNDYGIASNSITLGFGTVLKLQPVPAGTYWLEIRSYSLKKRMANPIKFN